MKFLLPFLLMSIGLFASPKIDNNPQKSVFCVEKSVYRTPQSEEFLTYYKEDFRKDDKGEIIPICDITYASYKEMYNKYIALSVEERTEVNNTPDYEEGYKIEDSIKTLIGMYATAPKQNNRMTLDQSTTIIAVVVVAVFGMSTICVFFVLKNNKIIE